MTRAILAFAVLALAGCTPAAEQNSAPEPVNAADTNVTDNGSAAENTTAIVLAMPERQRNIVFVRALMDAGIKCDGVTSSERLEDFDGKPMWRANCKGGNNSHMITITPDGTANIVSRSDR